MSSFLPLYGQALICMAVAALEAESSDDEDEGFSSSEGEDEHEENDDADEDEDEDEEEDDNEVDADDEDADEDDDDDEEEEEDDDGDVVSDSNHVQGEEEQDEGEGQEEAGCDGESSSEEEDNVEAEEGVGHDGQGAGPAEVGEDSDDDDSSLDGSAEESDMEEDNESLNILDPLALHQAAATDKVGAVRRLLLEAGDRLMHGGLYISDQDDEGRTALHIAVIHGHSKCVGVLVTWVEEQGLPDNTIEIADDHGCTALLLAVQYEAEGIASTLLEHGADVNTLKYEGDNPYEVAAARGNKKLLRLLIRFGARPKDADSDWKPPRLESEDDDYDVFGFHPCGITRRGMQQELEERVAVTGKEEKQRQSAQRVQEEEGNSADDDEADDDESSDCDDIDEDDIGWFKRRRLSGVFSTDA